MHLQYSRKGWPCGISNSKWMLLISNSNPHQTITVLHQSLVNAHYYHYPSELISQVFKSPFYQRFFTQNTQVKIENKKTFCCYSILCHWITAKFHTCHDSTAVVACVKFCSNHFNKILIMTKIYYNWIVIKIYWWNITPVSFAWKQQLDSATAATITDVWTSLISILILQSGHRSAHIIKAKLWPDLITIFNVRSSFTRFHIRGYSTRSCTRSCTKSPASQYVPSSASKPIHHTEERREMQSIMFVG